ncbi:MAG: M48 family metalloprotease [Candidatus Omnitrophica bacterium]|nr:M48 family metalloprotease [Candidatus Omnitrophota bacterium]
MRWWAVLSGLLAFGCVTSSYNPATQTQDYSLTSTSKEVAVGRRIAQRIAEELTIADDEPMQERVRTIGHRLAAVCDRQELIYSFTVVKDDDVNAFSLPGGYVFINDGLVKKTANEDELAGVIAHEVAHITARHAVKRFEGGLGLQIAQLATMAARQGAAARGLGVAMRAAQLAYARQDELEADRLGVKYLRAAGFDPKGILTFLEKLRDLDHGKSHYLPRGVTRPQYAMSHPYVPERLRAVKEELYGVADYIDYLNTPD